MPYHWSPSNGLENFTETPPRKSFSSQPARRLRKRKQPHTLPELQPMPPELFETPSALFVSHSPALARLECFFMALGELSLSTQAMCASQHSQTNATVQMRMYKCPGQPTSSKPLETPSTLSFLGSLPVARLRC